MSDYISREALQKEISEILHTAPMTYTGGLVLAANAVRTAPAADVREVKRGRWIKPTRVPDSMLDECSVCGFDCGAYTFNYCPNCGAQMEGQT